MKFKILAGFGLSAVLLIGACGGNKNTTTNNANTNTAVVTTPTPVIKTNETAATDPALKSKIEDALKKKGFTDITVDTSTTPMSLRGSVDKAKLAEVMATAMEANGGKPVGNQLNVK